ncbi:Uncharacterized protein APZ42_008852 [Daphnia magna]|uniref:Uncharacterized protein n=1 Tax=Daphnia magna TaxID=35525 RepID=A0A164EDI8_9CRUS|nr:Uncharacterized protein APZ42_008852 [Daphnia magna]
MSLSGVLRKLASFNAIHCHINFLGRIARQQPVSCMHVTSCMHATSCMHVSAIPKSQHTASRNWTS